MTPFLGLDAGRVHCHRSPVKRSKPIREPKTKGTIIVEQHRPLMNKLSDAQRQQLMQDGLELIYGGQPAAKLAHRRR